MPEPFNTLKLDPATIATLYRNHLYKIPPVPEASGKTGDAPTDWALGDNQRNILIITNDPLEQVISEEDLSLLTGILQACGLTIRDITLVNLKGIKLQTFDPLKGKYQPRTVILFGTEPGHLALPMRFPDFQEQTYAGSRFLMAPALSQLRQDKEMKRKLWKSLQTLFPSQV